MEFGPLHYVPILKYKDGEIKALGSVAAKHRRRITPLLELPPYEEGKPKTVKGVKIPMSAEEQATRLLKATKLRPLSAFSSLFVDASLTCEDAPTINTEPFISYASNKFSLSGVQITPVISLQPDEHSLHSLRERFRAENANRELGLRITGGQIAAQDFSATLANLLSDLSITPNHVHLILDQGRMGDLAFTVGGAVNVINDLPSLQEWKTLTLCLCAFPDVSQYPAPCDLQFDRNDWEAWRRLIQDRQDQLKRLPSFGDYQADSPGWIDFEFAQPTDTFRYTTVDRYILKRSGLLHDRTNRHTGKVTKGTGGAGYTAAAKRIHANPGFDSSFSMGDAYIERVAIGAESATGAQAFRVAGASRHLSVVAHALAEMAEEDGS